MTSKTDEAISQIGDTDRIGQESNIILGMEGQDSTYQEQAQVLVHQALEIVLTELDAVPLKGRTDAVLMVLDRAGFKVVPK